MLAKQPLEAARELEGEATPVARVLQIHIYSELKEPEKARAAYDEAIRLNHAPRVIELTAELAARARIGTRQPAQSDQWVLGRELEMLLAA